MNESILGLTALMSRPSTARGAGQAAARGGRRPTSATMPATRACHASAGRVDVAAAPQDPGH